MNSCIPCAQYACGTPLGVNDHALSGEGYVASSSPLHPSSSHTGPVSTAAMLLPQGLQQVLSQGFSAESLGFRTSFSPERLRPWETSQCRVNCSS